MRRNFGLIQFMQRKLSTWLKEFHIFQQTARFHIYLMAYKFILTYKWNSIVGFCFKEIAFLKIFCKEIEANKVTGQEKTSC